MSPRSPDQTLADRASNPDVEGLVCPACGLRFPSVYAVCPHDGTSLRAPRVDRDPLLGVVLAATYRIERVIARGGMGKVYEAAHTRLPRRFAVKVLHEEHAARPEAVRRFEREAAALAKVDDPHVLAVLDFVRTPDGRAALVTPLLEGEDLSRRLERDPVTTNEHALAIARDLAVGLAAAHRHGIVHRDLKPSNVFLRTHDDRTEAVILDFGVAKLAFDEQVTRTGVILGTPTYMAPEQARGSHDVDARADVYAVGACLYRMVTGHPPYEAEDAATIFSMLLAKGPASPSTHRRDLDPRIESLVQRAMARDPDARIASVEDLIEEIDAIASASSAAGPRIHAPSVSSLVEERRRYVLVSAAASWTLATSVAAFVGSLASDQPDAMTALCRALAMVLGVFAFGGLGRRLAREGRARWQSAPDLAFLERTIFRAGLGAAFGFALLALSTAAMRAFIGVSVALAPADVSLAIVSSWIAAALAHLVTRAPSVLRATRVETARGPVDRRAHAPASAPPRAR